MTHPLTQPPTGTVTFLFTDIEESTHLLSLLGADYWDTLEQQRSVLRPIWASHGGYEIDASGDSFMLAFGGADAAVAAAASAQERLVAVEWPLGLPLRVRMAIHTGFARPAEGRYTALAIRQAAHLVDAAHGRQILVSASTRNALSEAWRNRLSMMGCYRVGDFESPQTIYRVQLAGYLDVGMPPMLQPMGRHNLVSPATELIGRETDLAALHDALAQARVVTITGAGGAGKTRLAVELGLAEHAHWPDGAWLVGLDSIAGGDLIAETVLGASGGPRSARRPAMDDLLDWLGSRRQLLILDNCEHLLEACAALVEEILRRSPGTTILATSQAPLGVTGERTYALSPLELDAAGDQQLPAAARLFLARCPVAEALDPGPVTGLCRKLGGLPYAIELAAARTTAELPPERILAQLTQEAADTDAEPALIPNRHRSLHGVIDWTVSLLPADACQLLLGLATLKSHFGPELAAVVMSAGPAPAPSDLASHWRRLIEHSLILRTAELGDDQFRMPELVRDYARRRASPLQQQHFESALARHFADTVGPQHAHRYTWRSDFAAAATNVRGLIGPLAAHQPRIAQALATAVCTHACDTGSYADALRAGQRYLEQLPQPSPERVALLVAVCRACMSTGELDRAAQILAEAERLESQTGLPAWAETRVAGQRILLTVRRGDIAAARELARQALAAARTPKGRAHLLNSLALVEAIAGNTAQAADAEQQALALSLEAGIEVNLQRHHGNLAESYLQLGRYRQAAGHQLQALDLAREHSLPLQVAFSMLTAARLALHRDDPATAALLNRAGLIRLEALHFVLMDSDRAIVEQLRDAARAALGEARFVGHEARAELADAQTLEFTAEAVLRAASAPGGA